MELLIKFGTSLTKMNKKVIITISVLIFALNYSISQVNNFLPATKVVGYASIVHPIITFNKDGTTFNFSKSYTIGFPFGINFLKGEKAGFSFEFVPFIKAADGTSRVSNFLFHPGYMFRFTHGYTFITRLAFGTDGRYGVTPVFAKVFYAEIMEIILFLPHYHLEQAHRSLLL